MAGVRVLILGSSHVHHLNNAMYNPRKHRIQPSFNLYDVDVRFWGIPGMRARDLNRHSWVVTTFQPHVVYLQIGGNDLDDGIGPEVVGDMVVSFAEWMIKSAGVVSVVVGEFFPRLITRNVEVTSYNVRVSTVNDYVETCLESCPSCMLWRHKRMFPPVDILLKTRDGVHLNDVGNERWFKSIRGALIWARSECYAYWA